MLKFLEHFAAIREAMDTSACGTTTDGLYYDKLVTPDGTAVPVKVRSMVGHHPAAGGRRASTSRSSIAAETLGKRFAQLLERARRPARASPSRACVRGEPGDAQLLLGVVGVDHLQQVFAKLFDEDEFLSPYGLRAVSAYHRDHPYELDVEGIRATIDYEPAESTTDDVRRQLQLAGPDLVPAQLPR